MYIIKSKINCYITTEHSPIVNLHDETVHNYNQRKALLVPCEHSLNGHNRLPLWLGNKSLLLVWPHVYLKRIQ